MFDVALRTTLRISKLPMAALACALCAAFFVQAQTAPPAPAAKPSPQPPSVTTTVVVRGDAKDNYLPDTVSVGTLDGASLKEMPLAATVVTRELLNDQAARLLSDVVKNDASIDDDYVPVGYYGIYEIRGFPIDLASGLEVNGTTIAGEQDVPLENKERVELLKGIAGVESGLAAAGGLINYVTKRPAMVEAMDVATDHRGSAYGAVDLGRLFGAQKQVGTRFNLAGERIASYMNDTNGWRAMGAGAADWKLGSAATLKSDFEYQHKVERDGSGYQLLGGATPPNINQVYPSTMVGDQAWGPPDTYNTINTGARLDYALPHNWLAFAAASYSHSLIEDNVIYAYGCYAEAECNTGSAPYPWFFAPDGTYDIYDYRNPGELRIDAVAQAFVTGHIRTGAVTQDVTGGGAAFRRSVQQPGFYTIQNPLDPSGVVQDGAVYAYVGSENIYQPTTPVDLATAEDPYESAGPRRLWEDSHQAAGIVQDRIHLPARIQLLAGGRFDSLHDRNYSPYASCSVSADLDPSTAPTPNPCAPKFTDKSLWLPQYAITFNPVSNLTLYSNYGVLLSLAPQGPFWTDNGSQFLAPFLTRQAEIGAKFEPGQRILLTAALYRMRAPFFYPKTLAGPDAFCPTGNPGDQCFEQEGRETHNGIELNAEGKAANWMRLTASIAAISAVSNDTGTPAYDNKQILNVPRVHATLFADLNVPRLHGLHLMPGWSYSGRKEATRDDAVSVPSVNLFNLGLRYTPGGERGRVTFRLYADNIADKRYWSDTGANYGDSFLWLGAPTTVRLSAHYTF